MFRIIYKYIVLSLKTNQNVRRGTKLIRSYLLYLLETDCLLSMSQHVDILRWIWRLFCQCLGSKAGRCEAGHGVQILGKGTRSPWKKAFNLNGTTALNHEGYQPVPNTSNITLLGLYLTIYLNEEIGTVKCFVW